jgi:putative transposase
MSRAERRASVERDNPALPVSKQCRLLTVSPAGSTGNQLPSARRISPSWAVVDRQYLARPYYGSRRMAPWLASQGHLIANGFSG